MKASRLISQLQKIIEDHGDLQVHVRHVDQGRLTSIPAVAADARRSDKPNGRPIVLIET